MLRTNPNKSRALLLTTARFAYDRLSNFRVDYLDAAGKVVATSTQAGAAGTTRDIALAAAGVHAVRIQLNGNNPLSLAEVQVWGAPSP